MTEEKPLAIIRKVGSHRIRLLTLALILGHFVFLMAHFEPAISTPDANGYFAQARLFADHARTWFEPESPLQFVGLHWVNAGEGRYFSRYPPGLAVIAALPFKIAGPGAALLVNPILTSLTLIALFWLCALWVGEGWGCLAVAAMVVNPVVNAFAVAGESHSSVAFLLVSALCVIARWSETFSFPLAFLAGLLMGVIPTIRYPEVLFLPAVGLFILLHRGRYPQPWKSAAGFGVAALIPISCLLVRNHLAFGAFWKTGYSLTNEQTAFSLRYFAQNLVPYLQKMQAEGTGLFVALGLVGVTLLVTRRQTRREGLLLSLLILPITLLYISYYFAPAGMPMATMRFLLPTFYLYVVAGVWCLAMLADGFPRGATAAAVAVALFTVGWGLPQSMQPLRNFKQTNGALAAITEEAVKEVPPGAILIAAGDVQQHLDFVGKWRLVDESIWQSRRLPSGLMPAALADPERPRPMTNLAERTSLRERYQDRNKILEDLDRWAGPERKIFWIGRVEEMRRVVPSSDDLEVVAELELPEVSEAGRLPRGVPGSLGPGGLLGGRGLADSGAPGSLRQRILQMRGLPGGGAGQAFGRGLMRTVLRGGTLAVAEWRRSPQDSSTSPGSGRASPAESPAGVGGKETIGTGWPGEPIQRARR